MPEAGMLRNACLCLALALGVAASPAIDISLRTAFAAPPFLVELLETAAEENATAYHPLLNKIASGFFDSATSQEQLYTKFRAALKDDGHISDDQTLSSFDLALSLHSTAPRIAAHFQYYDTSIAPIVGYDKQTSCESWVHVPSTNQRYCTPSLSKDEALDAKDLAHSSGDLPFDRILGGISTGVSSILYADITSKSFRELHKTLSETARDGKTSYRVRYKSPTAAEQLPLTISGYGVELALKRTDYIVIDDREAEESETKQSPGKVSTLDEDEVADLRPLSQSELRGLGLKASTFVLKSEDPMTTLLKLTQDFPKHSSAIAATNASTDFAREHAANRESVLPPGYNILWINGVQITARDIDAYSLLEHLRRERKMINNVQKLGLTAPEAIKLLSHESITNAQYDADVQRYDWRDDIEGGNVIVWLNNLEKDKRYADWSTNINALLQRTYPGQLPPVARDVHNFIVPVDFSNYLEVFEVVEQMQNFVKRLIPIRIGLVPVSASPAAQQQAKVVYSLLDTYGLAAVLDYLEKSLKTSGKKHGAPHAQTFSKAISDRTIRKDRESKTLQQIFGDDELDTRVANAEAYFKRLAPTGPAPMIINGVPFARSEEWLQRMSQGIRQDVQLIQTFLYEQSWTNDIYIPDMFLEKASARRNTRVVPEDDKSVRHVTVSELPFGDLPSLPASADTVDDELVHLTIVGDLDNEDTFRLIAKAYEFRKEHSNLELALLHTIVPDAAPSFLSGRSFDAVAKSISDALLLIGSPATTDAADSEKGWRETYQELSKSTERDDTSYNRWQNLQTIVQAAGIAPGQRALIINGRVVGPFDAGESLEVEDLESLLTYERKKRLTPASNTIKAIGLSGKASTPLAFAEISNLIALSLVSDIPEGIFDAPPNHRTNIFEKWSSKHTSFEIGTADTASIHIVATIDPASESAQRWTPIIKTLSELAGVYVKIFLNPQNRLEELPVKRFYRYVVAPKPSFDEKGALQDLSARFSGLPADALLNIGMDIPPAWLVAPKDSVHDLDNIKLSAVKSESDITAVYELEHILIEGHSKDVSDGGQPPRGVQLVLGTYADPHFADTIIMANLGYFQFKANPGLYNLALQQGRSEEIFTIESAGTKGYSPQPGDESTEIALMSFRGATLFPRLARKPGLEDEDVLEAAKTSAENLVEQADKLLSNVGLAGSAGKYLSKAAQLGSSLLAGQKTASTHADINIFSVASGHLYERMLNIMMVSVMKHTNQTVKFWFIEQFLSPSFKDFVPKLAEEYGFQYEMVTYKWPHWLRGQKEKQREIWGYKILFLDVLFPLDLDKVIFVDADQVVRTDMYELVQHDLKGAPYGFTPMCDSRTEMEGFRFWKQGYWKNYLRGLPYHISALYVVDLKKFRQIAAGDRLRQQYHTLSADPASLSNLDQDLPNHMQMVLPIHSLPQDWLWCETWCSDEAFKTAKTIDLCNNPQTKEPKLERARRQLPEWTIYDDEIAAVARRLRNVSAGGVPIANNPADAGQQGVDESIQEQLQREDAEKEKKKTRDEL